METKKVKNLDGIVVSTSVIATLFGLTDRRVRQLVEEGVIDRVGNGKFELSSTVKKYILYLKTAADAQAEIDYFEERALHEKAKREIAEIELAVMKGKMHDASDVEKVMTKMLSSFRAKMLAIPSKSAPMLIARNEISVIQDLLNREIAEALQELSNYDPSMFKGEKYVEIDKEESEGEDNE